MALTGGQGVACLQDALNCASTENNVRHFQDRWFAIYSLSLKLTWLADASRSMGACLVAWVAQACVQYCEKVCLGDLWQTRHADCARLLFQFSDSPTSTHLWAVRLMYRRTIVSVSIYWLLRSVRTSRNLAGICSSLLLLSLVIKSKARGTNTCDW